MAAAKSNAVAKKGATETPYKLDTTQTASACKVLLKHLAEKQSQQVTRGGKRNLLTEDADAGSEEDVDGEASASNDSAIWLILTTKKHISDQKRLKPTKLPLPHPFLSLSPQFSICLITTDPQRLYKEAIASPAFPATLSARIGRVIAVSKLKTKYKTFEARRQLAGEHDIFLADDRIVTYLPQVLGKIFYKSTSKRPVPVNIAGARPRDEQGKRTKAARGPEGLKKDKDKSGEGHGAAEPARMAVEIERAVGSALVHLAPTASTSVKIGAAGQPAAHVAANVQAVVAGLLETPRQDRGPLVPQGWRNVRALHVKGANTTAFPIWLAGELWADEADVLEEKPAFGKKRAKPDEEQDDAQGEDKAEAEKQARKKRKADAARETAAAESKGRKDRLKKQKEAAMAAAAAASAAA